MGFRLWTFFMKSILRSLDRWEWFSEDLEIKRGILLRFYCYGSKDLEIWWATFVEGTRGGA
jgi:hypothetical protein